MTGDWGIDDPGTTRWRPIVSGAWPMGGSPSSDDRPRSRWRRITAERAPVAAGLAIVPLGLGLGTALPAHGAYPETNVDIAFASTRNNQELIYQVAPGGLTSSNDNATTALNHTTVLTDGGDDQPSVDGEDSEPFYPPNGLTVFFTTPQTGNPVNEWPDWQPASAGPGSGTPEVPLALMLPASAALLLGAASPSAPSAGADASSEFSTLSQPAALEAIGSRSWMSRAAWASSMPRATSSASTRSCPRWCRSGSGGSSEPLDRGTPYRESADRSRSEEVEPEGFRKVPCNALSSNTVAGAIKRRREGAHAPFSRRYRDDASADSALARETYVKEPITRVLVEACSGQHGQYPFAMTSVDRLLACYRIHTTVG